MTTRKPGLALLLAVVCFLVCATSGTGLAQQKPDQTSFPAAVAPQPAGDIPEWTARLELARLLSYVKRYGESLEEYRKVLAEKPDMAEARVEMARVLLWSGKSEEAKKALDSLPPESLSGEDKALLADLYVIRKEYTKAETLYRELLKSSPDDPALMLRMAEILSWTKRYAESLVLYEKVLAARPGDVQIRRKYAQVLSWAGKSEESIREYRRSLGQ